MYQDITPGADLRLHFEKAYKIFCKNINLITRIIKFQLKNGGILSSKRRYKKSNAAVLDKFLRKKKKKDDTFSCVREYIYVYFCLDICRDGGREPKVKLFSFLMVEIIPIKQILC